MSFELNGIQVVCWMTTFPNPTRLTCKINWKPATLIIDTQIFSSISLLLKFRTTMTRRTLRISNWSSIASSLTRPKPSSRRGSWTTRSWRKSKRSRTTASERGCCTMLSSRQKKGPRHRLQKKGNCTRPTNFSFENTSADTKSQKTSWRLSPRWRSGGHGEAPTRWSPSTRARKIFTKRCTKLCPTKPSVLSTPYALALKNCWNNYTTRELESV